MPRDKDNKDGKKDTQKKHQKEKKPPKAKPHDASEVPDARSATKKGNFVF